jgi:branched-chain amino acid transport system substrate-binding protein
VKIKIVVLFVENQEEIMLRKNMGYLLIVGLLLALAIGGAQAQDDEPLVIGVLTDQSGALQLYGFEQVQGFEIGLEYATDGTMTVGGRPIEIVVMDNGGDADLAAQQARELIEVEGAEILFGTVSSGVTLGLQQLAAENEVVLMMGPSASGSLTVATNEEQQRLLDVSFRACRNGSQDAFAIGDWAIENVGENWVIMAADYAFGQAVAGGYNYVFSLLGANFPMETVFAPLDTTDFTAYAQQILESEADGMILIWAGSGTITLMQQFEELGVFDEVPPLFAFSSTADLLGSPPAPGTVGVGIYHWSFPDNAVNDYLIAAHVARHGTLPELFSECGFATAQAIVYGVEAAVEAGSNAVDATYPENLVPALEGLEWDGPKGHYILRAGDHQALIPMYVAQVVDIDPENVAVYFEVIDELLPDEYDLPCVSLNCPAP